MPVKIRFSSEFLPCLGPQKGSGNKVEPVLIPQRSEPVLGYSVNTRSSQGVGYDILSTGLFVLPFALVIVIIAFPMGVMVSRIGVKPFIFVGAIIAAVGFAFASVTSDAAGLTTYLVIIAAGMGIQMVAIQNLLVLSVSPREMGLATS
jgi:MFS family permease